MSCLPDNVDLTQIVFSHFILISVLLLWLSRLCRKVFFVVLLIPNMLFNIENVPDCTMLLSDLLHAA